MFCENCGTQLSDTAKFCSGCGTPQSAAPAPAQPQRQPAPSQPVYQQPPVQQPVPQQQQYAPQSQTGGVYNPPGIMAVQPNNSFQFMQGEALFASHYGARFNPVSSAGYLHVTNMRVVWTKSLGASMLSHGVLVGAALANEAEIPLSDIVSVDGGRVRGSKGGIVIHTRDGKKHTYAVTSKGGTCNADASASKNIMMAVLNYAVSLNGGMR